MCLLSVIVPVYKVEKYLHKCVDSLIEASKEHNKEYEIILVDDGCPNNCGVICDEYSSKYNFITTIHKKNGGLSSARNAGIKSAKGKYVCFIDSDDYVNKNFAEVFFLLKNHPDCDIFKFPYIEEPSKKIKSKNKRILNTIEDINDSTIKNIIDIKSYQNSACIRIVKKELLEKTNNYFIEHRLAEDYPWSFNVLLKSKTFYSSTMPYYHYVTKREGSIMNTYKIKNFTDVIVSGNELVEALKLANLTSKQYKEYYKIITKVTMANTIHINKLEKEDKKQALKLLKSNRHLLKYPSTLPYRMVWLSIKIIGVKLTLKLLSPIVR